MLRNLQAALIGPIRQEILSGISDDAKFMDLKEKLAFLSDTAIVTADYELAVCIPIYADATAYKALL